MGLDMEWHPELSGQVTWPTADEQLNLVTRSGRQETITHQLSTCNKNGLRVGAALHLPTAQ